MKIYLSGVMQISKMGQEGQGQGYRQEQPWKTSELKPLMHLTVLCKMGNGVNF